MNRAKTAGPLGVAMIIALSALALLAPGSASAASPCSRGACVTLDGGVEPHTGSADVRFDVDVASSATVDSLSKATIVIRLDGGLDADLASVKVYNVPGAGKPVRNGNDITVDLAATRPLPAPSTYTAVGITVTPKPGAATVLHAAATLQFAARSTDPLVTTTASATVYNAPRVVLRANGTTNPYNFERTGLPHGRTSFATVLVSDQGLRDAPAGLPLRLTFSGGATLGDQTFEGKGVRWGVAEGSSGTPLVCSTSPDRTSATCLTRKLQSGGEPTLTGNTYVDIPIAIPADQPVGTANSLSVSIDVPGDPVASDNTTRFAFRSGPVTNLHATISSVPAEIPVGGSGVVTVRVSNDGPDTSSSEAQLEVAFETLPKSRGTVRPVRDGKHRIIQVARGSSSKTYDADLPALAAGRTFDVRFRVTASALHRLKVEATPSDQTTFDVASTCPPASGDYVPCATTRPLRFVAAEASPASPASTGSAGLANSGSRTGQLLGLALALLLGGGAFSALGRRRAAQ